ncbi:exodeoxyribonuclease VII large subunit [Candidatus Saccharibacteria bacterium]|nr:exodeoxyribonuclease VII large subunit [Candidatus Saccharibacteria bacterium]
MENNPITPSEFIAVTNQTLEYAYSGVMIVGEVASFKVNQGKWVFFDLKDEESSVSCFMTLWAMRQPLEDGMKVVVRGVPKLTKWGKFSVTVSTVAPVGEGSLKKAYELLKKKLSDEGLFDPARKREIPKCLDKIGVISSTQAAGYADFIKIINARWGGMKVLTAHTQVQGLDAPDQIIKALKYFNERTDVQVIAILRGGGSKDDLSCFNDEQLVRAIAGSKIPVITGIGHEVDESLSDLAADVRASTPSNVAEMLTPDRHDVNYHVEMTVNKLADVILNKIEAQKNLQNEKIKQIKTLVETKIANYRNILSNQLKMISAQNPEKILKQGYAIISGKISPGGVVKITTYEQEITTLVQEITKRSKNE